MLFIVFFIFLLFFGIRYFMGASLSEISISSNTFSIIGYKKKSKEYYFFLPKGMKRNEIMLNITALYPNINASIYDDKGNLLEKVEKNTVMQSFEQDIFTLKVDLKYARTQKYVIHVMQSDLPAIFLDIEGGNNAYQDILADGLKHDVYYPGKMTILNQDDEVESYRVKKVRGRGNSTWLRAKKPFQVKFFDDVSLLGLHSSKKLNLLANHWDGSLARNYIWLTLSQELGIQYSVNCTPSDLYINQEYMGSYLLANKVEASSNSVDVDDDGYLFEIMNQTVHDLDLNHGYQINIHYPDLEKMSNKKAEKVKKQALEYLNSIESLLYDESVTLDDLSDYIDLDSFVQYYWVQEISENYDASRGSNFLYVKDGKLFIGPVWDMDNTLNRSYYFADTKENYILENSLLDSRCQENWFRILSEKDGFSEMLQDFFVQNVDIFDGIAGKLDDYEKYIAPSAAMNYVRWPYQDMSLEQNREWISGDVDFDSSMELFRKSIVERVNYYKEKYDI